MSKSYFMSVVLHVGFFIATLLVTPPLIEKLEDKQITIELVEPAESIPLPVAAAKADDQKAVQEPEQQQALPAKAVSIEKAEVAKTVKAPMKKASLAKAAKAQSASSVTQLKAARAADKPMSSHVSPARAGSPVPETLDDIEASDLDYDAVAVSQAGALNENELDGEFSKVDQKSEAALKAQRSAFDQELKNVADNSEQELSGIEKENLENAKAMSDSLKATKTKNAAMLARIRAGEEAAEKERIAREGAAKAARDAAAKAAAAKNASATGGNGNNAFGAPTGPVRSIENLRQMAGNPKPSYAMEERFRKEQGTVVFQAFVTQQGALQNFKLVQSTGYRNLDGKTLAALKRWKFYPGQQGWVEIPQTWNLKGEAEEMPTTLRRKVSQR